jgi:AAA domain
MSKENTAKRLTHEQLRAVLTPSPGGRRDEYVCPMCEHGHLMLFGENGYDCKNECDNKALTRRLHELVGNGHKHIPKEMPTPSKNSGPDITDDPDWQGFTVKEFCELKKLPLAWVVSHYAADLRDATPMQKLVKGKPVVVFTYMDADHKVVFTRLRLSAETKPKSEFGSKMSIPFGLWLPTNKPDKKGRWPRAVIICEGESDQITLSRHGFPAIGIPGASNWKSEWVNLPVFKYADWIFIIREPGTAGKKFVETISRDFPGKAKALTLPVKDPSELHINNFNLFKSYEPEAAEQLLAEGFLPTFGDELVAAIRATNPETNDWQKFFHTVSELDGGEMRQLVKGFLPEGVTFLGSLSGVGKTWIGVSLARAMVFAKPFLGVYEVPEKHNVLYLVPEMGARSFRTRLEKMGLPDDDRFRCQTLKDGLTSLDAPHLLAAVKEMRPVVFLDTAIRFSSGEENSSSSNASGLANAVFALLRQGAVAVVCLHHSPKAAADADFMTLENVLRGTGDFGAMCDAVWGIQHARKSGEKEYQQESNQLTRLYLACVKPRDFEPADPFVVQGRPYIDEVGDFRVIARGEIDVRPVDATEKTEMLVRMVTANPRVSQRELMRKTGLHNDTIKSRLGEKGFTWSSAEGWQCEQIAEPY